MKTGRHRLVIALFIMLFIAVCVVGRDGCASLL